MLAARLRRGKRCAMIDLPLPPVAHHGMASRREYSRRLGTVALLAAAGLLIGPAHGGAAEAPDRPLSLPTRDVALIYLVHGDIGNGAQKLQVTYADDSKRIRVDYFRWAEATYAFSSLIIDRPANRMLAVMAEERFYVDHPLGNVPLPGRLPLPPNARLIRGDTETIIGLQCTDWDVKEADSGKELGSTCVTDDGIMLRMTPPGAKEPAVIAVAVRYGRPPPGIFEPPPDFQRVVPGQPPSRLPVAPRDLPAEVTPRSNPPAPSPQNPPSPVAAVPAPPPKPVVPQPPPPPAKVLPGWVVEGSDPKQ